MTTKHDEALAMVLCVLGGHVISTKPITGTGSLPPYEQVSTVAFAPKPQRTPHAKPKKEKQPTSQISLFEDKK